MQYIHTLYIHTLDSMKELHVSGLSVNDGVLQLLASKLHQLEALSIGYSEISEPAFGKLLQSIGGNLRHLNVSWVSSNPLAATNTISSSFLIDSICLLCPKLVELDISGYRNLTANQLVQLLEKKAEKVSICKLCHSLIDHNPYVSMLMLSLGHARPRLK